MSAHPGARRLHHGRGSVLPLSGRGSRRPPRGVRHDRGAAPRAPAAAPQRVRRHGMPAGGGRLLRAQPPAVLLPQQLPLDRYLDLLDEVPAVESRNGTMLAAHNDLVEAVAARWADGGGRRALTTIGGSDAHTLRRVGRTWTEAPGRTREEFLASLRAGRAAAGGSHGHVAGVARDAYSVIGSYVASLAGLGPKDHSVSHRALCLAFSVISLPAQFLPVALVWRGKTQRGADGDRRRAGDCIVARAPGTPPRSVRRSRMTRPRVAITGIGIVSALGITRERTWQGMLSGACGIRAVSAIRHRGLPQPRCRRGRPPGGPGKPDAARAPPLVPRRPVRRRRGPGGAGGRRDRSGCR